MFELLESRPHAIAPATAMTARYIPEIVFTMATISLGIHLLSHRKEAEDQRAYFTARITLLEDTLTRLRSGVHVPPSEFELIRKLSREPETNRAAARGVEPQEEIGWKDVLLGRRDTGTSDRYDQRDWEKGQHVSLLPVYVTFC